MTSEQLDDLEHLARTSGRKLHPDKALALIARVRELEADRDRLAAEVERLEAALRKVLAHTAYTVPREGTLTDLLAGLLASIERITNTALTEAPTPAREEGQ